MAVWKERISNNPKPSGPFPDLIARLLASRGFQDKDIDSILNPKLSVLTDPFKMKGMTEAVWRLVKAFKANEKICIYADFDLDGTSGLAVLKNAFERLGFKDISYYQPRRLSEGYGFHPHAVEELKHLGITLIVTVDVGITSLAAFDKAKELGVDVILTDHHLAGEKLPAAYCIVNPNQKDCAAGLGYLCGAGVAFYLARALKRAFFEDSTLPHNEWDLKELLDLFCIGTLTDMVPLINDNRVLVKHGMVALQNTSRPGLRALMRKLELLDRPLSSQDISIRFAPKLNALSRMESDVLPIHIYLETDPRRATELVDKIMSNNQTRQTLQSDAEVRSFQMLEGWKYDDFVYVASTDFHRGVIGLIATKLASEYNRPAFVGSINSEGMIVGSCRLPNGHETSLVQALQNSEKILNRFGGHAAAAGFELSENNQERFIKNLNHYYSDLKMQHKDVEVDFDTTADLSEINSSLMKWYDFLGPYGVGFQIPLLRFNRLKLAKIKELKGGHLKLTFTHPDGTSIVETLYFSPPEKKRGLIVVENFYDILGELQWNYFNNRQTIQLLVKDFKLYE